jgi:hypothetical protein
MCTAPCASDTNVAKIFENIHSSCEDGQEQDESDGDETSAGALMNEFNLVCLKDPNDNRYCFDKAAALERQGAFSEDSASDAFPDVCSVDCNTQSAKGVLEMGCCFPSIFSLLGNHGTAEQKVKNDKELKAINVAVVACSADKAAMNEILHPCTSADILVEERIQAAEMDVDRSVCSQIQHAKDRARFERSLASNCQQCSVTVMACAPTCGAGGAGRRTSTAGAKLTIAVKATGTRAMQNVKAIVQDMEGNSGARVNSALGRTTSTTTKTSGAVELASGAFAATLAPLAFAVASLSWANTDNN